jgi:uncharacterized membrane protein
MTVDPTVLITIVCMALVTYATRVSGFILVGRFGLSGRAAAWLHYVPGAVLVSIIAPTVLPASMFGAGPGVSGALSGGPAELLAGALAAFVAARTKNLLFAMASGVVAVWILRHLFGGY